MSINENGRWYQHVLALCALNWSNIEGTNASKICLWCLCMYVLCLWSDWFCRSTWQRVDVIICEKSLEMCICLWPEFDCPEVTLCSWQDIKIQSLLLLLLLLHLGWTPNMTKVLLLILKVWSKSEYSLTCFAHCQEFLRCANIYLPSFFFQILFLHFSCQFWLKYFPIYGPT